ncbi:ribosomal L11 methyltransferase [Methanohalobium evestigatum Z-7303]|uniref:Ribosomal L11 methyltransferase n=1 Tax=Methanohalobium evestigatum (strain ATCC BAA-1072 / DSM 3721 / NBRC 107634 / OCM 161 / Z-7303) TaxID=644295 RepID=D7E9E5_METEZ|nr:METTL5 family protein [Methanohalobium evestigatum]ADI74217.1 ribosomal L11 methyltransferase [Methanohalobium evestigatum Z-7303]
MKQRKLEMLLEQVEGFNSPDASLEQYTTPAPIAAELLHFAYMKGDIRDTVYDIGCGTGVLAIGAKLLGAEIVTGFDTDHYALQIADKNARSMNVDVDFICKDISNISGEAQTVVMNPPFGSQVRGSDRPFLSNALKLANVIYSIHNKGSKNFIEKFISPAVVTEWYRTGFPLKRTFKFHKKDVEQIEVEIYRISQSL